jgi:hypothetical protein
VGGSREPYLWQAETTNIYMFFSEMLTRGWKIMKGGDKERTEKEQGRDRERQERAREKKYLAHSKCKSAAIANW